MITASLVLVCLWALAAALAGLFSTRRERWTAIAALFATGVPILGLLTWMHGPLAGFAALGIGALLIRLPLPDEERPQDHPAE